MDKTDATLKALEKQIKATYTKAYQEMKKEMTDILSKIEVNPEMSLAQKMALMTKYDRLNTLSTQLANTAYNANTMAQKMINNEMVNVYDINYNGDAERLGFGLIDHTAIKKVLKQEENPFNMISSLRDKEGIRNQMKGQLLSGLLKGESMQNIARRLKDVSEKSLKDCIRIARTETTRVQNSAKMDIGKEGQRLGFTMKKKWIATTDGRVREDHLAMNGVEVPQDEPFVLPNGDKLMFPGDISLGASPENTINCRCTMIEFIKETAKDDTVEEQFVPKNEELSIKRQAVAEKLKDLGADVDKNGMVTLYHATDEQNVKSILKEGFRPTNAPIGGGVTEQVKERVFFGYDKKWIEETWSADGSYPIIEVKVPAEYIHQAGKNTLEVFIEGTIKNHNGIWIPDTLPTSTAWDRMTVKRWQAKQNK